jgi:LysR family hca operon transcriptional activator
MELRHLRYFVAVAEAGSLKVAAEKRLHTAQPSLSRQIRDLEQEVGAQLLLRSSRGVELTAAGHAFLDHARRALAEAEAAGASARRVARPARPVFSVGVLTGHEADCLPAVVRLLQDDMPDIEVRVFSGFSTHLGEDLNRGALEVAFLRREPIGDLDYRLVAREALVAILPVDHPLAADAAIDPRGLVGETFIGISRVPRVLRAAVNDYLAAQGVDITPHLEIDTFAMAISLVATTRGVAILPASIESFLPPTLTSRPLRGDPPGVDLVMGYRRNGQSALLTTFLSRFDALTARIRATARAGPGDFTRRAGPPR